AVSRRGARRTIGITAGDPRGIGPEVAAGALRDLLAEPRGGGGDDTSWVLIGPAAVFPATLREHPDVEFAPVERRAGGGDDAEAGRASIDAVERAIELAMSGELDGIVTGPISKRAVAAAGYPWPGHTELLRERTGVDDVT